MRTDWRLRPMSTSLYALSRCLLLHSSDVASLGRITSLLLPDRHTSSQTLLTDAPWPTLPRLYLAAMRQRLR